MTLAGSKSPLRSLYCARAQGPIFSTCMRLHGNSDLCGACGAKDKAQQVTVEPNGGNVDLMPIKASLNNLVDGFVGRSQVMVV